MLYYILAYCIADIKEYLVNDLINNFLGEKVP